MNFRKCAEAPYYWRYFSVSGFVKPLLTETVSILSFSSLWLKDMAGEQDDPSHLQSSGETGYLPVTLSAQESIVDLSAQESVVDLSAHDHL